MTMLRKLFGKYLLVTNTVSCGLMMGAGDLMQQRNEHYRRTQSSKDETNNFGHKFWLNRSRNIFTDSNNEIYVHDYSRTRNMLAVGLVQGPFHHYFYSVLERVLPGRSLASVVKKTCLDQTIASPTCLAIFFVGLGLLECKKIREIYDEIKLKLCDTWKVDCCFWPPTQCVNFVFVPLHYRVLYINFMTMIYDGYLSYMKYDVQYN